MAHSSLRNNPKLLKLARILGVSEPHAIGLLECFWWTVYDCRSVGEDGILPRSWGASEIAASAGWEGDPKLFVIALRKSAFLCTLFRQTAVHDYADWAPDYVRKRWSRKKLREVEPTPSDQTSLDLSSPRAGKRRHYADPTRPDQTQPNPTQPRSDSKDHAKDQQPPPKAQPAPGSVGSVLQGMGSVGSDRASNDRFRGLFVAHLYEAFGFLKDGPARRKQERPFKAIARKLLGHPDRDRLAKRLVALAHAKRDTGLDNPPAAWQKEVNEILTEANL